MKSSNATSVTLLQRAIQCDEVAWTRLMSLYRPLIFHWCRNSGIPAADVEDVAQEVLLAISKELANFQRARDGGFRAWVRGITRHKILDRYRRSSEPKALGGTDAHRQLQEVAFDVEPDGADDADEAAWLYRRALDLVRVEFTAKSWQAFWRVTVDNCPTDLVAHELGITPVAVRIAKSRVLSRLREEVGDLLE